MPQFFEGKLDAKGLKFGIVIARFNSFIGAELVGGLLVLTSFAGERRALDPSTGRSAG